jgi:hypothetical protein
LAVIAIVVPGLVIMIVCLLFVPGPRASQGLSKEVIWKQKLWDWHSEFIGIQCIEQCNANEMMIQPAGWV